MRGGSNSFYNERSDVITHMGAARAKHYDSGGLSRFFLRSIIASCSSFCSRATSVEVVVSTCRRLLAQPSMVLAICFKASADS